MENFIKYKDLTVDTSTHGDILYFLWKLVRILVTSHDPYVI